MASWWDDNNPDGTTTTDPNAATTDPNANQSTSNSTDPTQGTGYGNYPGTPTPNPVPATPNANPNQWILDALAAAQSTDDPNYWIKVIGDHNDINNPAARQYWIDRINRGDGSMYVRNGTMQKFQDGGAGSGWGFGSGTQPYKPFTLGDFVSSPGYQWQLNQGLNAIQKGAAARGTLLTGGTQKALEQYGQGLASQDYNNFFNRELQTYNANNNNYYTGVNSAFDKWYKTAGLGANAAAQ